jgi:hypothetical protein
MTSLEASFERDLREAVLDGVEREAVGRQGNLVHEFVQEAHDRLREYGRQFDMAIEPIIDSFTGVEVDRSRDGVTIRFGWDHEAAGYFEFGTPPHTIEGDPILSFVWEDPPAWVKEEFDQARGAGGRFESGWRVFFPEVDHPGMPAARYIRDTLLWLRQEIR